MPPSTIWTSGRGIGNGSIRDAKPLTTTATWRTRTIVIVSKVGLSLAGGYFEAWSSDGSRCSPRKGVRRQIIGYIDDYKLLMIALAVLPLLMVFKTTRSRKGEHVMVAEWPRNSVSGAPRTRY
jgi:hypothetical protein